MESLSVLIGGVMRSRIFVRAATDILRAEFDHTQRNLHGVGYTLNIAKYSFEALLNQIQKCEANDAALVSRETLNSVSTLVSDAITLVNMAYKRIAAPSGGVSVEGRLYIAVNFLQWCRYHLDIVEHQLRNQPCVDIDAAEISQAFRSEGLPWKSLVGYSAIFDQALDNHRSPHGHLSIKQAFATKKADLVCIADRRLFTSGWLVFIVAPSEWEATYLQQTQQWNQQTMKVIKEIIDDLPSSSWASMISKQCWESSSKRSDILMNVLSDFTELERLAEPAKWLQTVEEPVGLLPERENPFFSTHTQYEFQPWLEGPSSTDRRPLAVLVGTREWIWQVKDRLPWFLRSDQACGPSFRFSQVVTYSKEWPAAELKDSAFVIAEPSLSRSFEVYDANNRVPVVFVGSENDQDSNVHAMQWHELDMTAITCLAMLWRWRFSPELLCSLRDDARTGMVRNFVCHKIDEAKHLRLESMNAFTPILDAAESLKRIASTACAAGTSQFSFEQRLSVVFSSAENVDENEETTFPSLSVDAQTSFPRLVSQVMQRRVPTSGFHANGEGRVPCDHIAWHGLTTDSIDRLLDELSDKKADKASVFSFK